MSLTQPDPKDTPPTVLVVEDEILIRLAIADYLRDCGWRVLEAGTVAEAITVLEAADVEVHVVFSDVQMPGGQDGFALARWVRENRPGVRVLLTSGGPASFAARAGGSAPTRRRGRSSPSPTTTGTWSAASKRC